MPLPSEQGVTQTVLRTFTQKKPRPLSGRDCLVCAGVVSPEAADLLDPREQGEEDVLVGAP